MSILHKTPKVIEKILTIFKFLFKKKFLKKTVLHNFVFLSSKLSRCYR